MRSRVACRGGGEGRGGTVGRRRAEQAGNATETAHWFDKGEDQITSGEACRGGGAGGALPRRTVQHSTPAAPRRTVQHSTPAVPRRALQHPHPTPAAPHRAGPASTLSGKAPPAAPPPPPPPHPAAPHLRALFGDARQVPGAPLGPHLLRGKLNQQHAEAAQQNEVEGEGRGIVRACVHACMRACMRACGGGGGCMGRAPAAAWSAQRWATDVETHL